MPVTPELNEEEKALYEEMRGEKAPPKEEKPEVKAEEKPPEKPEAKAEAPAKEKEAPKHDLKPALDEARIENKDLRNQLKQMQTLVAEGDKKLKQFIESTTKRMEEKPAPKFEDDPAANLKHENEQLKKALEEINTKIAKQAENTEQGNRINQFAALVKSKEAAYAKENPDYYQAADFVAKAWGDEFEEAGFDADKVPEMVFQKSLAITNQAVQKGKDPAEAIHKIAKRFGFTAAKPSEEKKAEAKADGETKLKTIEKGLEASKAAGGAKGLPDDLTLASLAQMDDEAIEKLVQDKDWWSKNVRRSPLH